MNIIKLDWFSGMKANLNMQNSVDWVILGVSLKLIVDFKSFSIGQSNTAVNLALHYILISSLVHWYLLLHLSLGARV